ncbi:MAG: oxaloacetate-decarboxylating malate dehydrogenase [Planctomycetota bacterium]|jgi:malate dehydrogenase (oxaloacetate-decarboxylating)(NADP+)
MLTQQKAASLYQGVKLLHDPVRNKGTAFSEAERDKLGLRGLLPPVNLDQHTQAMRVMENLRRKPSDLERYIDLASLQDRNEHLFYRVLIDNLEELMPIVYTPTVGTACKEFGHIFRSPRGMYLATRDRGQIDQVLANWPHEEVRIIVVTDGGRILGLGDLGADGMGIPIGKLALYTACAGIPPTSCLPITLDLGTENEANLKDPLYIGSRIHRLRGREYDEYLEEFIAAVHARFPKAVIQLEDFATANAFALLQKFREQACLFDDDIQGTASVTLAGLYAATRITGRKLEEGRYLFLGAGEAGIGTAELITSALVDQGMPDAEARKRCWLMDSRGLVVAGRDHLAPHKLGFAHEHEHIATLEDAVEVLQPTALIGVSGQPGTFNRPVLEAMARINERPLIFALSNPTSQSECSAREAYEATEGRAIFASGSPFDQVDFGGQSFVPGQCNNAYIFPGLGLGLVLSGARRVPDDMFSIAAKALAEQVDSKDLSLGRLFPALSSIREVSARIALAVVEYAVEQGLASRDAPPRDLAAVRNLMFDARYPSFAD